MRIALTYRITALLMLAVFCSFSVGIPVVQYFCPMMETTNERCQMHESGCTNGPAINYQTGNCCSVKIVAERNTTPFLKLDQVKISFVASPVATLPSDIAFAPARTLTLREFPASPESPPSPLYILHSSLLI